MFFLNAAHSEAQPTLWLDVLLKGVKLKFQVARNEILGVRQSTAAITVAALGFVFVGLLVAFTKSVSIAAIAAFLYVDVRDGDILCSPCQAK